MTPNEELNRRRRLSDLENGQVIRYERFMEDTNDKLERISGQIAEIKSQMVTRHEYNESHVPLVKMVDKHEGIFNDYIEKRDIITKWGLRLLIAILIAALFSPHSMFVFEALKRIIK